MNYSKIVYFKNWSTSSFTYKFDNKEYTFEPGKVYQMPLEIAQHFANHLASRELINSGDVKDEALPEAKHKEYMGRCFPGGTVESVENTALPITEIKDEKAMAAPASVENKTDIDFQKEVQMPEEDVRDNKTLKTKKAIKKTKDDEYTK